MKKYINVLFLVSATASFGQIDNSWNQYKAANYSFGAFNSYIPTQKLFNRLHIEDTLNSVSWNANEIKKDTVLGVNADHLYALLYEMRLMSIDTATVSSRLSVFDSVYSTMGEIEFEQDEYHYPIGIFDYQFNAMDVAVNMQQGLISQQDSAFYPISNNVILTERKASMIGPLFDLYDSKNMAVVFQKDYFKSNYRTAEEVVSIELTHNKNTYLINWDAPYFFQPTFSENQCFFVKVIFSDSSVLMNNFVIHTPQLTPENQQQKLGNSFPDCEQTGEIENDGNKLKWCLLKRCGYDGRILKPYILITGYRPPIFGQSFEKTWVNYNDEHRSLLNYLLDNNYDVFLVKFNLSAKPYKHGMSESADLLEDFILWVNIQKGLNSGQENVIQGSSMGADIARLTLLTMEKKHFSDNSYPNHHTRLNIAYDGNFYGANLPFGYQSQIYSAFKYPSFINPFNQLQKLFLGTFLFATMNQKAVKELLTYHIAGWNENAFDYAQETYTGTPTHHWRRQGYYNQLDAVDYHVHVFPMPIHTRNIAISLGHITTANNYTTYGFNSPGEYWKNVNLGLWEFKIGTAKYMPSGQTFLIFRRKKIGFPSVKHNINVSEMKEIDNASGSYLADMGNIISVANWTYFTLLNIFDGKDYFSHKSVLTALGINKSLWPTDGSLTMDMQGLGLMNIRKTNNGNLIQSNHFGYPNLGRPTDHFNITPFEAIYVDNEIDQHIKLKNSNQDYVDSLNNFILNEVEPWYLGLQNANLGSQARSNYTYRSYRRAKHLIVVGHSVTPTTDLGDYVVEANAELTLKAGDEINLKSGTHFKNGSTVHIVPEYEVCNNLKINTSETVIEKNEILNQREQVNSTEFSKNAIVQEFNVFPNPATRLVTISNNTTNTIDALSIFDLNGTCMLKITQPQKEHQLDFGMLNGGMYLLQITSDSKQYTYKLLIH